MARLLLVLAFVASISPLPLPAHEIPSEAVARMLARAEGDSFQVVVRVPLRSMRDVEVPEFGPGYLDIEELAPQLDDLASQWIAPFVQVREEGVALPPPAVAATQVAIPSDRSLDSFARARSHLLAPRPVNAEHLVWEQVLFDVLLEYDIGSDRSRFSIRPGLWHLASRVVTSLRYELSGGAIRAFQFSSDPGVVPLDPGWLQAAWRFVVLGFRHILDGPDHLLFLFCLVVPLRRLRPLVWIVTAFTLAHSVTLIASAAGIAPDALWFPPLIETLIAVSILYMALENIVGPARRRWAFALGFGLVHGFGFSFALRETLQFAGSHLLVSLLAFNVGVEIGQVLVLVLLVPALAALFRYVVAERVGTILVSALAAHQAWHWMTERVTALRMYEASWAQHWVLAWAVPALAVAGGSVLAVARWRRHKRCDPPPADTPGSGG